MLTEPNAKAFASGISRILNDDELKRAIIENALKLSEDKYSYQAYINKTESIYSVLGNGKY